MPFIQLNLTPENQSASITFKSRHSIPKFIYSTINNT